MHCTLNFSYTQDMLTLHKATEEIKAILKWGLIVIISFILLILVFRVGRNIKEYFFPTPPPPPTVSFGKLPRILFPANAIDEEKARRFTYTLNTISGKLPTFKNQAFVYKTVSLSPNLLALQKAKDRVAKIGFSLEPTLLSETTYQWESSPSRKIVLDILSSNFNLSSNYFSDPNVLSAQNLPDENGAIEKATSFLNSISSFPSDIDASKTKTTLLTIEGSNLTPAPSLSKAKLIRVDFFQKDINNLPIFYPTPLSSSMNVFVASGIYEPQIVEANFFHQDISEISATYPIKTADQAFSELKKGKAYIAAYFGETQEISTKNVFLGYYISGGYQDYLLPIIIFEGNNGFYAYVTAIKNDWFKD